MTGSGHVYVFVWDGRPDSLRELLRAFGRFASDPDLDFTWHDAAILTRGVRAGRGQ